jgi:hypothetical protein
VFNGICVPEQAASLVAQTWQVRPLGIAVGLVSWLLPAVGGWDVVAVVDARAGRGR